jgi:hypothetical protein
MDSLAMALTSERQPLAHTPGDVQISVVIGTHEAGSELEETLASIAYQQEAPLWECLIVANGRFQADATLDRRLASDPRFRLLHSQVPGLTEALRLGCGQARGRWIARIDVGDVMEPNRLHHGRSDLWPELGTHLGRSCGWSGECAHRGNPHTSGTGPGGGDSSPRLGHVRAACL